MSLYLCGCVSLVFVSLLFVSLCVRVFVPGRVPLANASDIQGCVCAASVRKEPFSRASLMRSGGKGGEAARHLIVTKKGKL